MRVRDVMTSDVRSCGQESSMAYAAGLMNDAECGCVPVVDDAGRLVGLVTHRDICMAAYAEDRALSSILVGSGMVSGIVTILEDEELAMAERLMRDHRVRRLPVVNTKGQVVGVVTLHDVARMTEMQFARDEDRVTAEEVGKIVAALSQPRPGIVLH